jgi:Alternative complex III, ActD subunit
MSSHADTGTPRLYGLMAEFDSPNSLVSAARRTREGGYRKFDAYTPFPIEELDEALDLHDTHVPLLVLIGGIVGGLSGYLLQYWISVVAYPLNVGGRPFHSWPAFVPVTFEMTVLFGALTAVFGMLALNGLPMPYHPVFNAPRFALATRDRFFLCIEAADPGFEPAATRRFLEGLGPREVTDVEQ